MNDVQKQAFFWGSIVFLVVFLFPPHDAGFTGETSYRFLFGDPSGAYERATGKWLMYLALIAAVTFGIVSKSADDAEK